MLKSQVNDRQTQIAAGKTASQVPCTPLQFYLFPLSYSGNPGVNCVSHRGLMGQVLAARPSTRPRLMLSKVSHA
jgi:hypothetical protein